MTLSCQQKQLVESDLQYLEKIPQVTRSMTDSARPPVVKEIVSNPTPGATLMPSVSPRKSISVASHSDWEPELLMAVERLNAGENDWYWEIGLSQSDLSISDGEEGFLFATHPIALAVDFSSEFHSISDDEAERILIGDSDSVEIILWRDLEPNQKSLSIDGKKPSDPNYPIQQVWSVAYTAGNESPAKLLADSMRDQIHDDDILSVSAVGDIMLDRALGMAIRQGDIEYPFSHVAQSLQQADITIGNLESALDGIGQSMNKRYTFQAPADAARSLVYAGFDILSLANNHAMDYGEESLIEGIKLLNYQNILTIGAGENSREARKPVIIDKGNISIAFLAYVDVPIEVSGFDTRAWKATSSTSGLAWAEPEWIQQDVRSALELADLVIVVLHSGYEYVEAPSPHQVTAAKIAIDSGASLVIGHHAHLLQGVEFYRDGVIAYGLGNFAFQIDSDPNSAIFTFWLDRDGVREIEIIPVVLQPDGQPTLAPPPEAKSIIQRINFLSNLLNNQ